MEMETTICKDLSDDEAKAQYDKYCKKVLSEKVFLAWIMKECLEEYKDVTREEIAAKYIESEPLVGEVPVAPDEIFGKIRGANTEDSSVHEGTVFYDIKFVATVPHSAEKLQLIINVEAQNEFYPGYPLIKRGIYYGSRMISSQYGTDFVEPNYGDIKKVYSVWVCMNPPQYKENSINRYRMTEENLVGKAKEEFANYDLLTVIMVYLGRPCDKEYNELLSLLDILFSTEIKSEDKKQLLQDDFNVAMTRTVESEVSLMCNFSEGVYQKGKQEGRLEGKQEGLLASIENVMKKMNFTADEAMDLLSIPVSDKPKYLELLQQESW